MSLDKGAFQCRGECRTGILRADDQLVSEASKGVSIRADERVAGSVKGAAIDVE
jgi:hypothetical protein